MPEQPTLKRSMNLLVLTFYGLGTIIGAGIYVLIGEVAGVAGAYMPLSFCLAGLIALFTGLSYAELASRFPVSAGEAVYVKNAWNRNWLSGLVGWMIVLTGIVSAAAITNGFAGYLNVFIDLERHWAIIILCLVLCGVAVYGINLSANAIFVITVLSLAGLAYVVWIATAIEYWRNNTGENPRRYPGQEAASEPEVRWIIEQIEKFEPEVIVSVHAPYHLLDFDGPSQAPDKIGDLYLHQLGVYPGSLGNYAGLDLGIPVVTLELPSAGIMPSLEQIETMWVDILDWLNTRPQSEQQAGL